MPPKRSKSKWDEEELSKIQKSFTEDQDDSEDWIKQVMGQLGSTHQPTVSDKFISGIQPVAKIGWRRWSLEVLDALTLSHLILPEIVTKKSTELQEKNPQWCSFNRIAHAYLARMAGPYDILEVHERDSAYSAWEYLRQKYEKIGRAHQVQLIDDLINLPKYDGVQPVNDFLQRYMRIFYELKKIGGDLTEETAANILLTKLPKSWDAFLERQYEMISSSLAKLEADIISQARRRGIPEHTFKNFKKLQDNNNISETNITLATTYKKFPRKEESEKNEKKDLSHIECFKCHEKGHYQNQCPLNKTLTDKQEINESVEKSVMMTIVSNPILISQNISTEWLLDSGATQHVTGDSTWFSTLLPYSSSCITSDGTTMPVVAIGNIKGRINGQLVEISNVWYSPNCPYNILSTGVLCKKGFCFIQTESKWKLTKEDFRISGDIQGILCPVVIERLTQDSQLHTQSQVNIDLWHRRFGHINKKSIIKSYPSLSTKISASSVDNNLDDNDNSSDDLDDQQCQGCILGKSTRLPFGLGQNVPIEPLELVVSDVKGYINPIGVRGERYFGTMIDVYSGFISIRVLQQKNHMSEFVMDWIAWAQCLTNKKVKIFRTDGGSEYFALNSYFRSEGIQHQTTTPYSPQSNGIAERMNRTLSDLARAMLNYWEPVLPENLWGFAIETAAYVRNRVCLSKKDKTAYELFTKNEPDISNLRVFGCCVWMHNIQHSVFGPRAKQMLFVGYPSGQKGYYLWDIELKKVIIARDVRFDEFHTLSFDNQDANSLKSIPILEANFETNHIVEEENYDEDYSLQDNDKINEYETLDNVSSDEDIIEDNNLRRSSRIRTVPSIFRNGTYELFTVLSILSRDLTEPQSYNEAINGPFKDEWQNAINEELNSHSEHKTWELVTIPKDRKLITSKWVFRLKRDAEGNIQRFKARLVARGDRQIEGEDYRETFAPVAKLKTMRIIIALSSLLSLVIHQMDVVSAFLNGNVDYTIYMKLPQGIDGDPNKTCCHILKSLYGLKQSPRLWYQCIHEYNISIGLNRSIEDSCLYFGKYKNDFVIVVIYVDDLIIAAKDLVTVELIKKEYTSQFKMKDIGQLNWILGIEVTYHNRYTCLGQQQYLRDVLARFNMEECNPLSVPIQAGLQVSKNKESYTTKNPYRELIGCLMYLMVATRPDIAYVVSFLSRFCANPSDEHWNLGKKVLRYLKGTEDFVLVYQQDDSNIKLTNIFSTRLLGFCDAGYAGDKDDERKSVTGWCYRLSGGVISWKSIKQKLTATSTMESEYIATWDATKEALWLKRLGKELNLIQSDIPVRILGDNTASIRFIEDPCDHETTKHIDVKVFRTRQESEQGNIKIEHIHSLENVADIFTKALQRNAFEKNRQSLGLYSKREIQKLSK